MLCLSKLFICFIVFSFFGWCLEMTFGMVTTKKIVNRGFLIGPICPLYGLGCVLLYTTMSGYADDPIILAVASIVLCSVLEYFAGYILEKLFKTRWWDYSEKKFNINGRICLEMAIPFGLLGLGVVYVLFPGALYVLSLLNNTMVYVIASILLAIFITDLFVSLGIIVKFTDMIGHIPKDMTEEISKFARENLGKENKFLKRLIDSFPNLKIDFDALKKKIFKK